jgi:hypothetical protein
MRRETTGRVPSAECRRGSHTSYASKMVAISSWSPAKQDMARWRFRFSVRLMLFALTCVAIALAYYQMFVAAWSAELGHIVALRQKGGQVFTEPRGRSLIHYLVDDPLSERAVYVHLSDPRIDDAALAHVAELPYVEVLSIKSPQVTDAGLIQLESLKQLRDLNLVDTQKTDEGLVRLRRALPHLQLITRRDSGP